MYNARIETDAGKIVRFGYEYGNIFDITPLSGVDVSFGTSQGFQQVGETVETQSVQGISRTIRGTFIDSDPEAAARAMLRALPIFTTGRLVFDDKYFCRIHLKKTPYVHRNSSGKCTFDMMVYCETPYWLNLQSDQYVMGGYTAAFSFPVIYDSHIFGVKNESAYTNCVNSGAMDVPFTANFRSETETVNFGIININTLEHLRLNMTLTQNDEVTVSRENGRLYVQRDGEDIFSVLDEDSDLFMLHPGDNVLRMTADSGLSGLKVSISYNAAEIGVI